MKYDVIVVGSGMGGMTAAALCGLIGMKVLIVEKHKVFGGMTVPFKIKGRRFNAGLHWFNWPARGQDNYEKIWTLLSGGGAPWVKLPDDVERFLHNGKEFIRPNGHKEYQDQLVDLFPNEKKKIIRYLKDIRNISEDFDHYCGYQCLRETKVGKRAKSILGNLVRKFDKVTVREYFDTNGFSTELQNHLAYTWDNYGLPPNLASFTMHAFFAWDSLNGSYIQKNSAMDISKSFRNTIKKNNGEVITGHGVEDFLVKDGTIQGVLLDDGRCYESEAVISTIGFFETFEKLEHKYQPRSLNLIKSLREFYSFVVLNYCLDEQSSSSKSVPKGNYFVFDGVDSVDVTDWEELEKKQPQHFNYVNIHENQHSAQVIATVNTKHFYKWKETQLGNRGDDYVEYKELLANQVEDLVESVFPGFSNHVIHRNVSTPLSIEHYTSHMKGLCYGVGAYTGRYNLEDLKPVTPIKGLLLGGQDVCSPGVVGAFLGGLMAVSTLTRKNVVKEALKLCEGR